jgi:hypothetical protein
MGPPSSRPPRRRAAHLPADPGQHLRFDAPCQGERGALFAEVQQGHGVGAAEAGRLEGLGLGPPAKGGYPPREGQGGLLQRGPV